MERVMQTIDLRRDTITIPTAEMKDEAFKAPLGDSVYGEDPKQRDLEKVAAEKLGKEAAIFVPSGTQGNLVALLTHTERGNEIIVEENAHIRTSETGGASCVGGLMIKTVYGEDGAPAPEGVEDAIRKNDIHYPRTALICLESTHYRYGGIVPPLDQFKKIQNIAVQHKIPVHLDGARIFNSSIYLGVDVKKIARYADSVMVSLSKGLGAPVGSVLCGTSEFIEKAKRHRKMLGGGMRQTGWLCACGIIALSDNNINNLKADHENAKLLAQGLSDIPGFTLNLERVHTNFVLAQLHHSKYNAFSLLEILKIKRILATQADEATLRFVTSREIEHNDIVAVIDTIRAIL
ncbi:MAG: aminotransferase class I/II-fold pyridoxal phosphate-dependent enzyme [Spirochaetota bacterium]|nr:MAG: aminotransferase class I/II-fold pyridoxal phosphate-dependent enzyme [Spirochaetota bacterium]